MINVQHFVCSLLIGLCALQNIGLLHRIHHGPNALDIFEIPPHSGPVEAVSHDHFHTNSSQSGDEQCRLFDQATSGHAAIATPFVYIRVPSNQIAFGQTSAEKHTDKSIFGLARGPPV